MAETRLLCVTPKECTTLNELDENSRIAVSVLMDDGWSIYRVGLHGEVTLSAVPYVTADQKADLEAREERVSRMLLRHRHRVNYFFGTVVYLGLLLAGKLALDLWNGSYMWASEAVVLAWLILTDLLLYITQLRNR